MGECDKVNRWSDGRMLGNVCEANIPLLNATLVREAALFFPIL